MNYKWPKSLCKSIKQKSFPCMPLNQNLAYLDIECEQYIWLKWSLYRVNNIIFWSWNVILRETLRFKVSWQNFLKWNDITKTACPSVIIFLSYRISYFLQNTMTPCSPYPDFDLLLKAFMRIQPYLWHLIHSLLRLVPNACTVCVAMAMAFNEWDTHLAVLRSLRLQLSKI